MRDILNRFRMNPLSDITTISSVELRPSKEDKRGGDWPYREAVGSLMWLSSTTGPNISSAVRAVVRHYDIPTEMHWKAGMNSVTKTMAYLDGTTGLGLTVVRGLGLDRLELVESTMRTILTIGVRRRGR